MYLKDFLYLSYEFLRPCTRGGFYGKEGFISSAALSRPCRLYLAISHSLLYFQKVRLPGNLPPRKISSALKIEAARLLGLITDTPKEPSDVVLAFYPLGSQNFLIAFQEQSFFKTLEEQLPKLGVVCGAFPAWVALWAWAKARGPLEDGFYLAETTSGIEGFEYREGKIKSLLPSDPQTAFKIIEGQKAFRWENEGEKILAEGASLVPKVFSMHEIPAFDFFPLRLRPQIPKKALILWLIPPLFWGGGLFWEKKLETIQQKEALLDTELKKLRKKEEDLSKRLAQRKNLEVLSQYVKEFKNRPPLLEALEELARLLPKDSWIRKFSYRAPEQIRIWGESGNALEVIKRLEESPYFADVKVLASITKDPRTGKERFSLQARLIIPRAPAPSNSP